jgi:sugar O-acyltransferase (sialic acid O-acetyltransferase NeuD family)
MTNLIELIFPLLNPNEPEAILTAIHVSEGQHINPDDLIYTLETTKAAADIEAQDSGYVLGFQKEVGSSVSAGEIFAFLSDDPNWIPPVLSEDATGGTVPSELRITRPALELAKQHGLELDSLPKDMMLTKSFILDLVTQDSDAGEFDPTAIIVYGGGGHGKSVIDLLKAEGKYKIAGIIDDGIQAGTQIMGLPVLGGNEKLAGLYKEGVRLAVNAVGGIGNISSRVNVFNLLDQNGFDCPAVIHPTAFIESSAKLSPGCQVFPLAYIGSESEIGFGNIINTGSIISHDCKLAPYVNIAPGAILAGAVSIGEGTLVGMGVTINLNVRIGEGCRVGNSSTVKSDLPGGNIVRAGGIWPE